MLNGINIITITIIKSIVTRAKAKNGIDKPQPIKGIIKRLEPVKSDVVNVPISNIIKIITAKIKKLRNYLIVII